MGIDWSDGDYTRTARMLEPVARLVVKRLGVSAGQRVLDVGCGTGNAALEAARAGARVTGVDPAGGLLAVAERRAAAEGLDVTFLRGDAQQIPGMGGFDVALSVFAVIFADDPAAAARGMIASVRPGGRVAITSWLREGAIHHMAEALLDALPPPDRPRPRWDDPRWIDELLGDAGAQSIAIEREELVFRHTSPEALFDETEEFHPFWRWARRELTAERWELVRRDSVAALVAGNEDPAAFATTSPYLLITARR